MERWWDTERERKAYAPKIDPHDVPPGSDREETGDLDPRQVSLNVPYDKQYTNHDCSESVANMIHKWRGDYDEVIPEGESNFYFVGLADNIGGQLETDDPGMALAHVEQLVKEERKPTPIRLGERRNGHTVLVIGVIPGGTTREFVIHDPDMEPYQPVKESDLLSGEYGKYYFEFAGDFIDIDPND